MNRSLVLALSLAATLAVRADGPGLSLRISDESAPAGSIVQIKIDVTEPKPISTGRGKVKVKGVTTVNGIVLMNEGQDAYGVAMVNGDELTFVIESPASLFGTAADYPIVGIAGTVAPGTSTGTKFPLTLDPAGLGFRDPSGLQDPTEITDGVLTVAPGAIAIGDVKPGSAVVPAGGVVHIHGANFTPNTRLQLSEAAIAQQVFVSSSRIDVTLAQTTRMHGLRIRARNEGTNGEPKSECEYFSYERTTPIGASIDDIFGKTVPLFAPSTFTDATIHFPRRIARKQRAMRPSRGTGSAPSRAGLALQNLATSPATASIELLDAAGHPYAVTTVSIGPDQHLVREVGELFGIVSPPSGIRVRSNIPIHILGLTADPSTGGAAALPPH